MSSGHYDAIVVGGGFYGVSVAAYLKERRGAQRILMIEREDDLLCRASYNNQARVHNGYHYPRSFTTAYRSRINFPRFVEAFPDAIESEFIKLYAIARINSKVAPRQFERFCHEIGAPLKAASAGLRSLFNQSLIAAVYEVTEIAFNAGALRYWAHKTIERLQIELLLGSRATQLSGDGLRSPLLVSIEDADGRSKDVQAPYVFNCTYSGLNQIRGVGSLKVKLKHELAEMALVDLPGELKGTGVTVMDGSFFSVMPFPDQRLHTLSHVRYTPHFSFADELGRDPYEQLAQYDRQTHVDRMLRDASRFVPLLQKATYQRSLFEVKTILERNEGDDGRPILFERSAELPGLISILGGKIDNIYDVLERLEQEVFDFPRYPKRAMA